MAYVAHRNQDFFVLIPGDCVLGKLVDLLSFEQLVDGVGLGQVFVCNLREVPHRLDLLHMVHFAQLKDRRVVRGQHDRDFSPKHSVEVYLHLAQVWHLFLSHNHKFQHFLSLKIIIL